MRRYWSVGPALGVLKPVYYEVADYGDTQFRLEKFNSATHMQSIFGRASFFKGVKEIKVVPGGTVRGGFSFEYSTSDISIHAIETGLSLDIFPKNIEIMATEIQKNDFFFVTLFISYRFGRVIDASGVVDDRDLF